MKYSNEYKYGGKKKKNSYKKGGKLSKATDRIKQLEAELNYLKHGGQMSHNDYAYGAGMGIASDIVGAAGTVLGSIPVYGTALGAGLGGLSGAMGYYSDKAASSDTGKLSFEDTDFAQLALDTGVGAASGSLGVAGSVAAGAAGAGIDALTDSKTDVANAKWEAILNDPSHPEYQQAVERAEAKADATKGTGAIGAGINVASSIIGGKVKDAYAASGDIAEAGLDAMEGLPSEEIMNNLNPQMIKYGGNIHQSDPNLNTVPSWDKYTQGIEHQGQLAARLPGQEGPLTDAQNAAHSKMAQMQAARQRTYPEQARERLKQIADLDTATYGEYGETYAKKNLSENHSGSLMGESGRHRMRVIDKIGLDEYNNMNAEIDGIATTTKGGPTGQQIISHRDPGKMKAIYNQRGLNPYSTSATGFANGGNMFNNSGFGANTMNKFPVNEFNAGGTHEENPLGGIPQGMGANGKPNLVEEGELKIPDPRDPSGSSHFIVSAQPDMKITKELAEENNLPKKYVGKTVRKAADMLLRKNDVFTREDDTIQQNSIDQDLIGFMQAHESLTKIKEAKEQEQFSKEMNAMAEKYPQQMQGMMSQGQQPQQPMGIPGGMPQGAPQQEMGMAKYGGNIHQYNPNMLDAKPIPEEPVNTENPFASFYPKGYYMERELGQAPYVNYSEPNFGTIQNPPLGNPYTQDNGLNAAWDNRANVYTGKAVDNSEDYFNPGAPDFSFANTDGLEDIDPEVLEEETSEKQTSAKQISAEKEKQEKLITKVETLEQELKKLKMSEDNSTNRKKIVRKQTALNAAMQALPIATNLGMGLFGKVDELDLAKMNPVTLQRLNADRQLKELGYDLAGTRGKIKGSSGNAGAYLGNLQSLFNRGAEARGAVHDKLNQANTGIGNREAQMNMSVDAKNTALKNQETLYGKQAEAAKAALVSQGIGQIADYASAQQKNKLAADYNTLYSDDYTYEYVPYNPFKRKG